MKKNQIILLTSLLLTSMTSCEQNQELEGVIRFNKEVTINSNFGGLGVEWGTYEDNNKLVPEAWDRITSAVDYLSPSIVRCMFNLDWICGNLDKKGTDDKNDDTWEYDFSSQKMKDCCDVLDYCQDHNVDVAFGFWNVIGNADTSVDTWGMMEDCTSDIRWAKMSADVLDYLVHKKGYTCIKWFVNTNEPNWTGQVGSSKMAYNTYAKWEQGVRNVRSELDKADLKDVDIVGGDTTGFGEVAQEYMKGIATNLKDVVHNYGAHFYIGNMDISVGNYKSNLTKLFDGIRELDKDIDNKNFYIWEAGLLDGKDVETDCNGYIQNYSYGYRMADYTLQSIQAGVDGVCFWDLDDAMHFMYSSDGMTPKEWGMFSTLASAPLKDQEYRPWYYSSALLSKCLRKGNKVYGTNNETELVTISSTTSDNKNGYVMAVNHSTMPITGKFLLEEQVSQNEKTYVYIYKEGQLKLDEFGKVAPNFTFDKSINNIYEIEIPASSLVVISSELL